ncbi:MAG: cyclic nucleotide-binding domain-containing protein [Acidimicrobiia bacterium]
MNLDAVRASSELLSEVSGAQLEFLESVSQEVRFAGGDVLFEEDGVADTFYIILEGKVGLEMTSPGKRPIVIQTLGDGELVGVSWLFPPHRWSWRARAVTDTAAIAFDAARVRAQSELDRELAHRLLGVVAKEAITRLHSTRVQLLDLYGTK